MITSHVSYICCISAISKNKVGLLRIVVIKPGACSGIGKGLRHMYGIIALLHCQLTSFGPKI